ncbi:T-complex protein 1 subunit gamma [Tupaia chinensis]|uniref:CCT-gamma n=2 Tax=Tupaia chinensis TaxID=246437 RepID=L9KRX8_TUPCH|nr:T-complex protein 1 subunit gamma [Tupaia chinensis]
MHPTVVISAYRKALDDMISTLKKISTPVDVNNRDTMLNIINSSITTKAISRWSSLACNIALDAVRTVQFEENGRKEIDIKKYARVEKIPGGIIEDSCVLRGVMINKDVTHPRMRRFIKNPRIVLLDSSLEYKKGESQTDIEITREEDFTRILQMEEEYIQQLCEDIIQLKPDVVITEKGISDLAQHYLMRANVTARGHDWCGTVLSYRAVAQALEVIPRTLIQNCGANTIHLLTSLRAKHTQENCETWGVNGETGTLVDMKELGIWEPLAVKLQTYKTAVEMAVLLLRIDDIVSGHKKKGDDQSRQGGAPDAGQE